MKPGQHHNHGYSGPLKVSYGGAFTNIGKDFLEKSNEEGEEKKGKDPTNVSPAHGAA